MPIITGSPTKSVRNVVIAFEPLVIYQKKHTHTHPGGFHVASGSKSGQICNMNLKDYGFRNRPRERLLQNTSKVL